MKKATPTVTMLPSWISSKESLVHLLIWSNGAKIYSECKECVQASARLDPDVLPQHQALSG